MEDVQYEGGLLATPPAPKAPPLALYRRYRPDTFAQVIGQEHVTEPLQRALVNNRVNHAYLFSGPRGCGKTSSARILARALNCAQAPVAEPCGECESCRDLATGGPGSIDVIEIDAASHGGVDDARDLRERAFFAPVSSRFKIYIVDEAHMVTTAGFNALLKLVEEPPPHVKFIFATTEPDKVIGTIRSRTHHYPFRLVPPRVLSSYLATLCEAEGIEVENGVLPLVVRAGSGSVRDSLSVLDQLLGGAAEDGVSYRQAAALLGYTPDSLLDEMLDAFAAGDARGVFAGVDKVIEVGQDPRRFAEDLLRRLRDLVIVAAVPEALTSGLVDVAVDQGERLSSQAAALGPGELTRAAEVIAAGLTDMRGTTAPRLHLELMCARVLLPGTDVDERGIHARLDRLERRIGVAGSAVPAAEQLPRAPTVVADRHSEPSGAGRAESIPPAAIPPAAIPPAAIPPAATAPSTPEVETATVPTDPSVSVSVADPAVDSVTEPGADQSGTTAVESEAPTANVPDPSPVAEESDARTSEQPPRPPGEDHVVSPPEAKSSPNGPPGRSGGMSLTDVRQLWPEVLEEVKGRRRFTWILLSQNAHVAEVRDGSLVLAMPNAGVRENFSRGGSEDILREAIVVVLGADFTIETIIDVNAPGAGGRSAGPPARPAERAVEPGSATPPASAESSPGPSAESLPPTDDWPEPARPPSRSPEAGSSGPDGSPHPASAAVRSDSAAADRQRPVESVAGPNERPSDPSPNGRAPGAGAGGAPRARAGQAAQPHPRSESRDADEGADPRDSNLDESVESGTELLARHLGAEIIGEEETRA